MASPGLESFCCAQNFTDFHIHDAHRSHSKYLNFQSDSYNIICIVTSACSIIGAVFLMVPWSKIRTNLSGQEGVHILPHNTVHGGYQKNIIFWLSVADMMACLGILVRASVWLRDKYPLSRITENGDVDFAHVFCAVITAWIQYFYTSTYMWTFIYAVDVTCRVTYRPSYKKLYHFGGWIVPLLLSLCGLLPLYIPSILQCTYELKSVLPGYLVSVVPMLLVMIINPILYLYASSAVKNVVTASRGRYTDTERLLVLRIREKYFLIMLVFYVCWIPNVLNCVLLIFRYQMPIDVFIAVWNAMAVSNPLQAFLNVLAYKTFSQANFGRARLTVTYIWRAFLRTIRIEDHQREEAIQSYDL